MSPLLYQERERMANKTNWHYKYYYFDLYEDMDIYCITGMTLAAFMFGHDSITYNKTVLL